MKGHQWKLLLLNKISWIILTIWIINNGAGAWNGETMLKVIFYNQRNIFCWMLWQPGWIQISLIIGHAMGARLLFLSYSPVTAKFGSNQVAIVLNRKSSASLWNLVSFLSGLFFSWKPIQSNGILFRYVNHMTKITFQK